MKDRKVRVDEAKKRSEEVSSQEKEVPKEVVDKDSFREKMVHEESMDETSQQERSSHQESIDKKSSREKTSKQEFSKSIAVDSKKRKRIVIRSSKKKGQVDLFVIQTHNIRLQSFAFFQFFVICLLFISSFIRIFFRLIPC